MPVRIYDIARKLGIASREVLTKAKDLGIENAKVASSSLDKITAEYLEQQIGQQLGIKSSSEEPEPVKPAAPKPEPIVIIKSEEPEAPPVEVEPPLAVGDPEEDSTVEETSSEEEVPAEEVTEEELAIEADAPVEEKVPEEPVGPKIGERVGFIDLKGFAPRRGTERQREKPADAPRRDRDAKRDGKPLARGDAARVATKPNVASASVPSGAPLVIMKPPIVVRELAAKINRKPFQLIADLMELGVFANVNQAVEEPVAQQLCAKHGFRFELEKRAKGEGVRAEKKKVQTDQEDKSEDMELRPPVVTIMGHVDHGKTTLLDRIRKSNVVAGEAGGITQHIGAYTISFPHPERKKEIQKITFLDTPGHAAFSAMRARGADVTDIVILVVGADDGVKPQTLEALSHAKAAEVPIIVAVNKMDHPGANTMRVRQQLQEEGLTPDDWGGDTIFVECSALKGDGVDKVLEMILLQAELLELRANSKRQAIGNVIESGLQPGGPTVTVLVRKGTLHIGDVVICGHHHGRVRALISEDGQRMKEAGPSYAVSVLGLNGVPRAGDEFSVVKNEKEARQLASERLEEARVLEAEERRPKITLDQIFQTLEKQKTKALRIVVKADTQGSVEAIVDALKKIESKQVNLEVIHNAVGTITESDVLLCSASSAIILGFHTRIDTGVAAIAKREGVEIKLYAIIYELIDQVKDALSGLLPPVEREVTTGVAEVRQIFGLSKGGNVAGCFVRSGRISRGKVRVKRRDELLYEGITQSLRRFQDEVNEVKSGVECGIRVDGFDDFEEGDTIECYAIEYVKQSL